MRRTFFVSTAAIAAVFAAGLPAQATAIAKLPVNSITYELTILTDPLGGSIAEGNSITNRRLVGGFATLSGNTVMHAVLWPWKGTAQDLGTLGGPNSAIGWPNRNEQGVAAGIAETSEQNPLGETWSCAAAVFFLAPPTGDICLGFRYQNGTMTGLSTFGGYDGFATGINNRGEIVGWAETTYEDPTCQSPQVLQFEAALWNKKNEIQELQPYGSDPDGAATAINTAGQAVGISGQCGTAVGGASAEHMLLWQNGTVTTLPTNGGQYWNTPMDINDNGGVTGFSDHPGDSVSSPNFTAFLWTQSGGTQDLGALSGDSLSEGLGINNSDQVVGVSFPSGHGFIWQSGTMTDLNTLLPPNSAYTIVDAQEINNAGYITGQAEDNSGNYYAFVARPKK
jgi:probable HAF family extracellular repeat protein